MTHSRIEGTPPPASTPPSSPFTNIGKAIGHLFILLSHFPRALFDLALRISKAVFGSHKLAQETTKTEMPAVSIKEVSPPLSPIVRHTIELFYEEIKSKEETVESPRSGTTQETVTPAITEKEGPHLTTATLETAHTPTTTEKEVPPLITTPKEAAPLTRPTAEAAPISKAPVALPAGEVDVPDDGNCLFYSFEVGIERYYGDDPEIAKLLPWKVDRQLLTGDLSKAKELLKEPAAILRRQAADYLQAHLNHDEVMLATLAGVIDHNDVARKKLEEEEAVIPILEHDITTLEKRTRSTDVVTQLKEKSAHLQVKKEAVAFQREHLASEDDLGQYVDITKEDHVYAGTAQLYALCKLYNIQVTVLFDYGKPTQRAETFNLDAQTERKLTIAHVKGNHFILIAT